MLLTGDEARLFYPQLMGVGGGSLIFLTTKEAIRRGIAQSELRLNLLRICAREPHTIHDLIHAPEYPGIKISLFSIQAEINVSVELGELKSRMLLVRVGRVPDPVVPQGTTELLRTSLLAFLLSPELCWAEPAAYELYLRSWLSQNGLNEPAYLALVLAFPAVTFRAFYVAYGGSEAPEEMPPDLPEGERVRVFGSYQILGFADETRDFGEVRAFADPAETGLGPRFWPPQKGGDNP